VHTEEFIERPLSVRKKHRRVHKASSGCYGNCIELTLREKEHKEEKSSFSLSEIFPRVAKSPSSFFHANFTLKVSQITANWFRCQKLIELE
jgi:hypothetical protein